MGQRTVIIVNKIPIDKTNNFVLIDKTNKLIVGYVKLSKLVFELSLNWMLLRLMNRIVFYIKMKKIEF